MWNLQSSGLIVGARPSLSTWFWNPFSIQVADLELRNNSASLLVTKPSHFWNTLRTLWLDDNKVIFLFVHGYIVVGLKYLVSEDSREHFRPPHSISSTAPSIRAPPLELLTLVPLFNHDIAYPSQSPPPALWDWILFVAFIVSYFSPCLVFLIFTLGHAWFCEHGTNAETKMKGASQVYNVIYQKWHVIRLFYVSDRVRWLHTHHLLSPISTKLWTCVEFVIFSSTLKDGNVRWVRLNEETNFQLERFRGGMWMNWGICQGFVSLNFYGS